MGRLTAAERRKLPPSDFALPPDGYPDEDKSHALAAIREVAANGTPAQRTEVHERVAKKYPTLLKSRKKTAK